jgi:hypothetical protein
MTDTHTLSPPSAPGAARPSADDVRRLLAAELSLPSRLGHTLLLLASLGGTGVVGALLLTEPALPARTRAAMALMAAIGLSWAAFAAWVLARRRVLLAAHHVVAARMAVAFTTLFTLGALGAAWWGGAGRVGYAAAGVGGAMLAAAVAMHARARRRVAELTRRRAALERRLGELGGAPR